MTYTVQQLAKVAGISVRTLHYYDEIGLLAPSYVEKNGYRYYEYYEDKELLKLQQILFFRELDFELDRIKEIIGSPYFDPEAVLLDQRRLLGMKKKHFETLIHTIDDTMKQLKSKKKLDEEKLYGAFTKKEYETYKKEAEERWGKGNVARSEQIVKGWSPEKMKAIQKEGGKISEGLVANMEKGTTSPEVQALVDRHYKMIIQFYDTSWPLLKIYRGLGQMYVEDDRFAKNYTVYHPDLPVFMRDAMAYYCDQKELKLRTSTDM